MNHRAVFYPESPSHNASSLLPVSEVLVIEDDPGVAEFLRDLLGDLGYRSVLCYGVGQALEALRKGPTIQVALVDIHLTSMTGFDLLEHLKGQGLFLEAVMMTGRSSCDPVLWRQATEVGAHDILQKPLDQGRLQAALARAFRAAEQRQRLQDLEIGTTLREVETRAQALQSVRPEPMMMAPINQVSSSPYEEELLDRLVACARLRDDNTGAHCARVGRYVRLLAEDIGMNAEGAHRLEQAAMLHDLGKIGVSDRLIHKAGPLAPDEMAIMRGHAAIGHGLLAGATHPVLKAAAEIALSHHERFDGTGYPLGLKGDEIPLSGRLTAICDVYDALRMPRAYKDGWDHAHAVKIILYGDKRTSPHHFDPSILSAFARNADRFDRIYTEQRM